MVAVLAVVTELVVTVNATVEVPAPMVTVIGKDTNDCMVDSVTVRPPAGAAAERVTVPVAEVPPATDAGDRDTPVTRAVGTFTVKLPVATWLLGSWPLIDAVPAVATGRVTTVNVAVLAPARTVTLVGILMKFCEVVRPILKPAAGAFEERVTVAVAGLAAVTAFGETDMLCNWVDGPLTVKPALAE